MFNKQLSAEDKINLIGLENLDDIDKDVLVSMFKNIWIGDNLYDKPSSDTLSAHTASVATLTQNLMILKQVLQMKENIFKQNKEIIHLLKQIANQNSQSQRMDTKEDLCNISQTTLDEICKFEELLELNILTQEEFDKKKKELLNL